jgi:uncharacterized membrane protein/HD superfamily phosphodiesterase
MKSIFLYDGITFYHCVVLFAVYSFFGWIIEVVYRSFTQKRFINAGFLHGSFIPIYGFGAAFIIILEHFLHPWNFIVKLAVFGIVLTLTEYAVGLLFEKIFRLKLWDYSTNRFNLRGRICLLFSMFWTAIAFIFVTIIHPFVARNVLRLDGSFLQAASIIFTGYITMDFIISVTSITSFRKKIAFLYSEYFSLSNVEVENIITSFSRLRSAFPNLNRYVGNAIDTDIRKRVNSYMKTIMQKITLDMKGRKPYEREFYNIVKDVYKHEEFMKLDRYFHHNSSIYAHVRDVAYLTYRICKYLKLDYRSGARGALLHDFFLYDWRDHDLPDLAREKYHGVEHPKIALANAEKYFTLNDIERDIIVKHMWPLTLMPPRYKESYVVSFADKYLSSKEFFDEFKKHAVKKRVYRPRKKPRADTAR